MLKYVDVLVFPISSVQSLSRVRLSVTPWTAAHQASLSIANLVYSNSCPSSRWCHPTISSSVVPSSSRLQSFPASESFQMSQFFTSGGQIIGVSASASNLPMNIQDWFPLGLTGLISLLSKGLSRVFSNTTVQKHQFFGIQLYVPTLTSVHDYWKKTWPWLDRLSLLFNMLSRLVIAFLPRSKRLFISWLQSPSAVIFEPKKIKFLTISVVSPSICHELMGPDAIILVFWMLNFKPTFSLSSFTSSRGSLVPLHFLP